MNVKSDSAREQEMNRNSLPLSKAHRQRGIRSLINYTVAEIEELVSMWDAAGRRTPSVGMQWAYVESIKAARRELEIRSGKGTIPAYWSKTLDQYVTIPE